MKNYAVSLVACTFTLAATVANADEAEGTIRTVNPHAASIVLESGQQFRIGEGASLKDLKPGMNVKVTFNSVSGADEDDGGGLIATRIQVVRKG